MLLKNKLKQILIQKKRLSHFKKDEDYKILKNIIKNRKNIFNILDINNLENDILNIIKIQKSVFDRENKNYDKNDIFEKKIIIPKKYLRMNTLIHESYTKNNSDNMKFNFNNENMLENNKNLNSNKNIPENNELYRIESENKKNSNSNKNILENNELYGIESENKNILENNESLSQTQLNFIENNNLIETNLQFIYEIPFNINLKLCPKRYYILQNLPTCLPPLILNPKINSLVIDTCASPGNKTSHLAAIMKNTGRIFAFEKDKKRFDILKMNLKDCKVKNTICYNQDFTESLKNNENDKKINFSKNENNFFDSEYILVDPSCSGSGIHNNYKKDDLRLKKLSFFQKKILNFSMKLKKAKKIIYSTCSIHEEENEMVVEEILRENIEWELANCNSIGNYGNMKYEFYEKVRRFERKETIGFFCALFVRKNRKN